MIPYSTHAIDDEDVAAVVDVLRHEWLTQGQRVGQFESAIAGYCGARSAAAVSSGSAALHLACLALDFGPGDVLWTSPLTFASTANAGVLCGGEVDFVDIDPDTGNLSVPALESKLETAAKKGCLPKIVIPVHFAGQSCAMVELAELGRRYGFRIIEDAAHALGGDYRDDPVGSCRHSDCATFSFHPVKSITTGEGGMVVTNDAVLAERIRRLRSHGIMRDAEKIQASGQGAWYYEQIELGLNYRLTDIQAALGLSQLKRLDAAIESRKQRAAIYDEQLAGLASVIRPVRSPFAASSWHLYAVRFSGGEAQRRAVFDDLRAADIGVQVHYVPVHLHPFYRARGFKPGDFPYAEAFSASVLSLPLFPALTPAQQAQVVEALRTSLQRWP